MVPLVSGTVTVVSSAQGQASSSVPLLQGSPMVQECTVKTAGGALYRCEFNRGVLEQGTGGNIAPGRTFTWTGADVPELLRMEAVPVAQP